MSSIEYMRHNVAPWGRPLDIAIVTGGKHDPADIAEIQRLTERWRSCGGGKVHSFHTLYEAVEAAHESTQDWLDHLGADTGMPASNPIGFVAAIYAPFAVEDDWENSPLDYFYSDLKPSPVVRALIGGDELMGIDTIFFDNGLIDMRLAMNSVIHVQDKDAWAVLADEIRNLVFNRLTSRVRGLWDARPVWLVAPELNSAVTQVLKERDICNWEWIAAPDRLICVSRSGDTFWLYIQSLDERQALRSATRPRTKATGNVISILPQTREPYSDSTPLVLIENDGELVALEGQWLTKDSGISFVWSDIEASNP